MAQHPFESWLASRDLEKVIDAIIMKCQHPAIFCFADEYCHLDGECFIPFWLDELDEET